MSPPNEQLFNFEDHKLKAFGDELDLTLLARWIDTLRNTLVSWAEPGGAT
jgi:hypothetical protein